MCSVRKCIWLVVFFSLISCGGSDLFPSGEDKTPAVVGGSTGSAVGQKGPDFSVPDTKGGTVTLASALASRKAMVLYFTMWCPICDSHMSHMLAATIPSFPDVGFFAVDYVSGTVTAALSSEIANGFADTPFSVLADTNHTLLQNYQATMGTTIVIDSGGIVRMNEDYKDGARLTSVLSILP
jgi:peroxiredoxin